MPPKKIPTSSLSVIELLVKRALYRTLTGIQKMYSGSVSPETSPSHNSPATKLPSEVFEIITANLRYDTRSLRACTFTCHSRYIDAVPYLYHTLAVNVDRKPRWHYPIAHMYTLGLLPPVKRFRVHGGDCVDSGLSPKLLSSCTLRQFSALTNVQDLGIEYLEIPKFMPKIQRYFRNFMPTVRSLTLREPRGSCRQIIYVIGLFQHLPQITVHCGWDSGGSGGRSDAHSTLCPSTVRMAAADIRHESGPLEGYIRSLWGALISLYAHLRRG